MIGRLAAGCEIVARRRSEALAAWVAAGGRAAHTGGRAARGPGVRRMFGGAHGVVLAPQRTRRRAGTPHTGHPPGRRPNGHAPSRLPHVVGPPALPGPPHDRYARLPAAGRRLVRTAVRQAGGREVDARGAVLRAIPQDVT